MSVETLMRSKNLLPVQVIASVPSNPMGSSQSGQKAAFEEALHNSIESSLRSVAVAPSSVFSTLFLSLRPASVVNKDETADIKPNSEQLNEELNKQNASRQESTNEPQNSLLAAKFPHTNQSPLNSSNPSILSLQSGTSPTPVCRPPALIPASHVRHTNFPHNVATSTSLPPVPRPPMTLMAQQQQQLEARVEQLKQLQRLHAWKQLHKDKPLHVMPGSEMSASGNNQQSNLPAVLGGSGMSVQPPAPIVLPSNSINGMYSNGNFHGTRITGSKLPKGFCKSGKDIRLTTLENDSSFMVPCPNEYVLLALQTSASSSSDNLVIIAINLKSLPPPNSSSQALSVQCVGCGEKAIHTFIQLVEHVGLDYSEVANAHLKTNSSHLIGAHARFYLVRDRNNARHLIRGPALMWNKQLEAGRVRSSIPVPRFSVMQNPMFRNQNTMLPTPTHFTSPKSSHPPLVQSLSGPTYSRGIYPLKRKASSINQESSIEIFEDEPRRYTLNKEDASSDIVIPEDLALTLQRKLIIMLLHPLNQQPRLSGDVASVVVTSRFSECLGKNNEPDVSNLRPFNFNLMLLVTVQYLVSLGTGSIISSEGFSHAALQARKHVEMHPHLNDQTPTNIVALAALAAAASEGRVEFVVGKVSLADIMSQCIVNAPTSSAIYQVVACLSDHQTDNISFHILVTGMKQCRVTSESLLSPSEHSSQISQGLISLPFTQLRLSLSEVTTPLIKPSPTSPTSYTARITELATPSLKCSVLEQYQNKVASLLLAKVHSIYASEKHPDISHFTSLRFIFLLPPSPCSYKTAVNQISNSGVLSLLYKTSLPVTSLSSQVVIPVEPSSKQRVLSMCKQWEGSSTLLVLVDLDSSANQQSSEGASVLNHPCIVNLSNVLVIQCSTVPYLLLTNSSRVPPSNQVFHSSATATSNKQITVPNTSLFYFGTTASCSTNPPRITYDLDFENLKDNLLLSHHPLHTSLVACELIIQHYITALIIAFSEESERRKLRMDLTSVYSALTERIVEDMIGQPSNQSGATVLIRIPSSVLTARFFDTIKHTRDKLGQQNAFEIVLYNAQCQNIEVSEHFLQVLRTQNLSSDEWVPTSLADLTDIPCMIVYEGELVSHQDLPRTLRHIDLRMAFEDGNRLTRSKLEMELSLAASVCHPNLQTKTFKSDPDDDGNNLHVIESDDAQSDKDGEGKTSGWESKEETQFDSRLEPLKRKRPRMDCVESDFISAAMRDANLQTTDNGKETKCNPVAPKVVLPKRIYDILKSNNEGTTDVTSLLPCQLSSWSETLHPILDSRTTNPDQVAAYYRKWTKPLPGHPDYNDSSDTLDENENQISQIDPYRVLLTTPPNSNPVFICCNFLKQLHRSLMKMLEIEVYDDVEDRPMISREATFHTLLGNPVSTERSQITNSCYDLQQLHVRKPSVVGNNRKVVTISSNNNHAFNVRRGKENVTLDDTENSSSSTYEVNLAPSASWSYKGSLNLRLIIPVKSRSLFNFIKCEDGSHKLRSIRLREQSYDGLKTPIVSFGNNGAAEGLYNLRGTLDTNNDDVNHLHMVVVKECDEFSYTKLLPNHVLLVLPQDFDVLGRGAMKFAAQALFTHFYDVSIGDEASDTVWPFVMMMNDDCVAWSSWKPSEERISNPADEWSDISLKELLENVESSLTSEVAAVGFRPWSTNLTRPNSAENLVKRRNNVFTSSYIESCVILNLYAARDVFCSSTRFNWEDLDWSLRLAAAGLPVQRFENIALCTKVMPAVKSHEILNSEESVLVTAADSEFVPFSFHPSLLLEKHFNKNAASVFPLSQSNPLNPVLCIDCYISLGTDILVEFTSSDPSAPDWALDYNKLYGGLLLYCPASTVTFDFLLKYQFAEGATVCVIGHDRSSLRQTVVKLNLESEWHFRLTDEFLTANHTVLSGSNVRPLYFLTGMHKNP
nr:GREB1-like protein isoform X2 [Ciona intestinalis]|eukprot:XP_018668502.1 GREB1-like protein isoform X2 [Ciona intestinalis]